MLAVCIALILAMILVAAAVHLFGRPKPCVHDGRLDHIPETWRVKLDEYTLNGGKVELGVCKRCGALTDAIVANGSMRAHVPIAGAEFKVQGIYMGTVTNLPPANTNQTRYQML